jgi:hypothetical protein
MIGILKLVFPPSVSQLYWADADQFLSIYATLPLNVSWIPTSWLTDVLVEQSATAYVLGAVFTFILAIVGYRVSGYQSEQSYTMQRSDRFTRMRFGQGGIRFGRYPILTKDLISVHRMPSESGYLAFLLSIAVFFFGIVGYVSDVHRVGGHWADQTVIFVFSWIVFFVIAFGLRFVFTLMAKEGRTAWHLFALPVSRDAIVRHKLLSGALAGSVLSVSTVPLWLSMAFADRYGFFHIGLTVWSVFCITAVITLMGMVSPNFTDSDNPERISTSGMGIVTLLLCVSMGFGFGSIMVRSFQAGSAPFLLIVSNYILGCVALVLTYGWSKISSARYQF